ncbi:MAG: hypothetical protein QOG26_74, partial [Solirubrobacterales bacterium]|nr:hypothetical protein [Solirubrobacterales bacterium]
MDSRTPPSSRASGSPLSSRASEARRGISSPRLAIVLLAALLLGTLAAGTQALAASPTGQDTDFTPIPKDGRNFGWTQFDGATFGRGGDLVPNSQTPFTVDFFNVRFDPDPEKGDGLAGGAACADSETPFDKLGSCERVPAIWQFKDSSWQQVALPGGAGSGDPKPGYVGAIAYMADGNVLAVGGDGVYPRRESSTPVDAPDYTDPAGKARAWLYDGSAWKEVSDQFGSIAMDGGETPGGLSALDCANHTRDTSFWNAGSLYGGEDCVAGGLHQLWMWQDGGIAKTYDDQSTSGWTNKLCANVEAGGGFTGGGSFFCTFSQSVGLFGLDPVQVPPLRDGPADSASGSTAPDFRFRVREIRWTGSEGSDRWAAVTAGCCSESPGATNGRVDATGPRVLLNDGSRWSAGTLNEPDLATVSGGGLASAGLADSYYSVTPSYSSANGNPALFSLSLVASPGGPAADGTGDPAGGGEPGARLIWDRRKAPAGQNDSADNADLLSLRLGGVRLVSADGDFTGPSGGHAAVSGAGAVGPDGLLDWAVGSLTSPATCESPGLASTCQGVAYTTLRQTQLTPSPLTCTPTKGFDSSTCGPSKDATGARYATEAAARDQSSQELMSLPSYALNSFTNVPNTAGDVAWAVGDKGAILRLGGKGTVGSPKEPTAPQLGAPRQVAIADRSAYEEGRPPATTGEVGPVPPLAARPLGRGEPSLIPVGSADPNGVSGFRHPNSIAMSRDGSEGWASAGGSQGSPTTLAHYSAGTWTVCDATGIAGQLPADRACSDLVQQFGGHISLRTLSRLPLENDSDPANDDEFEVMALGDDSIALYRDGRWSRADQSLVGDLLGSTPETGVVFSAPDDGWLVTDDHPDGTELHHFDGTRWTRCGTSAVNSSPPTHPELCGDPARRLPLFKAGLQGKLYLAVAGERAYLAGTRAIKPNQAAAVPLAGAVANSTAKGTPYPVIYHHDPGGEWTADYDPGCESRSDPSTQGCLGSSDSAKQGSLTAFSVAQLSGGRFAGWAAGTFGAPATPRAGDLSYTQGAAGPTPGLLRLDPSVGSWRMWPRGDASSDYLVSPDGIGTNSAARIRLLTVAAADGEERSLLIPDQYATLNRPPILEYGGGRDRWQALPTPFLATDKFSAIEHYATGFLEALAPDGTGGLWLAVGGFGHFYHYTDRHPEPVFTDAPDPIREPIVATAAGADASFWVATTSNSVYRYDRVTGWDRMTIPGWDRGRLVTNPSAAAAIAFGADGSGVLVGKGGRIADLSSGGGVLDAAAGVLCSATQNVAPCGTSYYLRAAGVAPDGSAIVGGDHMALLWRPGHGRFRSITKPREKSADTTITGISMPSPDRAWLTTDAGQVFAGTLNGEGDWSWKLAAGPSTLTTGSRGEPLPIHAIALDSSGRGLAVGDGGLILQSDGHGSWQRLDTGRLDDLYSVALSPGGYGDGTLIGGGVGLVLTRIGGRFEVARPSDLYNGLTSGWGNNNASRTIGVAVLPGYKAGEVEAWAATQMFDVPVQQQFRPAPFPGALLHYTNAPSKLLDGGVGRVPSLSDAPAPRSVDISFAAFGKQECQIPDEPTCPEMQGSNLVNEVISRRVGSLLTGITPPSTDLIPGATAGADKAAFAVFTGDAGSSGGRDQGGEQTGISHQGVAPNAPIDTDVIHHRWSELVAQPLQDAGVPLFGALGGQDLSQTSACSYLGRSCPSTRQVGNPGPNLPWREAMSAMPAPWGAQKLADGSENKPPPGSGGYDFVPVPASGQEAPAACSPATDTPPAKVDEQKAGDQTVPGQSVGQNHIDPQCASAGGAHTHYAVDVLRNGTPAMRLVVVDTSLKTLSGIAATQNPVEEQLKWLTDVLASRPEGERAVIVTETPAYSYGPGGVTDTLTDSTSFEALIAREGVDAVISGRLGWNGLFYTIAPGVHSPCPGGAYPAGP